MVPITRQARTPSKSCQRTPRSRSALAILRVLGAGFLLFVAWTAGCAPEPARSAPPGSGPILVGEFHALTGPSAARGRALHAGFLLAIEDRNARGGVHGRPIEVRTFDDRGAPDETRVAVRRLLDEDRAVLLVGGTTRELVAIAAREADGAPYLATFGAGLVIEDGRGTRLGVGAENSGDLDRAFADRWRARGGSDAECALAAAGFDLGLLTLDALASATTYDRDDLWTALASTRVARGARGFALGPTEAETREFERARLERARVAQGTPAAR